MIFNRGARARTPKPNHVVSPVRVTASRGAWRLTKSGATHAVMRWLNSSSWKRTIGDVCMVAGAPDLASDSRASCHLFMPPVRQTLTQCLPNKVRVKLSGSKFARRFCRLSAY